MSQGYKSERLEVYKYLSNFLKSKGASSAVFSKLEKLLEPNGIFLKQRNTIESLKKTIDLQNKKIELYEKCRAFYGYEGSYNWYYTKGNPKKVTEEIYEDGGKLARETKQAIRDIDKIPRLSPEGE